MHFVSVFGVLYFMIHATCSMFHVSCFMCPQCLHSGTDQAGCGPLSLSLPSPWSAEPVLGCPSPSQPLCLACQTLKWSHLAPTESSHARLGGQVKEWVADDPGGPRVCSSVCRSPFPVCSDRRLTYFPAAAAQDGRRTFLLTLATI